MPAYSRQESAPRRTQIDVPAAPGKTGFVIDSPYLVLAVIWVALAALAWYRPWWAIGFVVNGSVPYYAALDVMQVAPTGPLTGSVVAVPAIVAAARLVLPGRMWANLFRNPFFVLFIAFVLIWYTRWLMDPPAPTQFGARAIAFMFVFALVPFVCGLSANRTELTRRALMGLLIFGMTSLAIMLAYWAAGAVTHSTSFSGRWEPIPYLSGGLIAIDLGVTCLVFFTLYPPRRSPSSLLGFALVAAVLAIDVRIASRGPFLFLLLALGLLFTMHAFRGGWSRTAVQLLGLAAALFAALTIAGPLSGVAPPPTPKPASLATSSPIPSSVQRSPTPPPRVEALEGYFSPSDLSTKERLNILQAALGFVAAKPVIGWGGSLVGREVNGHPWDYSHNVLLDPWVETGVVGAIPYWSIFVALGYGLVRLLRRQTPGTELAVAMLPLLAFVLLEGQVSGHVATSRALWLVVGLVAACLCRNHLVTWPKLGWSRARKTIA